MEVQVIEKLDKRIDRITGTAINARLKVAAYCRVSTDSEDQKNSYESQLKHYRKKINDNIRWTLVDIYADKAISGTQDYRRSDFMRMIQDALDEKIDIIITKSISRFARNTLDTLKYVRMLKERNIAIIFEEENINTLEMAGELLLTILSSVAQQESETISSHVTLGLEMKMKRGEMVGYNRAYGYNYNQENKSISINETESPMIEYIFNRYCLGIGTKTIASELTEMGVLTPKGLKVWRESTVLGIIKNPLYKGDLLMGKTYTMDPITHKRIKNYGEKNQYYVKGHHSAIITEEQWNKAQEILEKRSLVRNRGRMRGNYSRKYTFSSRIFCGYCGSVYARRCWAAGTKNEKKIWHCMTSTKKGATLCPKCKGIRENVLEKCFVDAYELLCRNNIEIIEQFMDKIKKLAKDNSNLLKIQKLEKEIEGIDKKLGMLVDLKIEGNIDETVYIAKKENYDTKKERILHDIELLELEKDDENSSKIGIQKIEEVLKNNKIMPEFDKDVFEAVTKKIIIGEGDDPLTIIFVLKNGDEYKETLKERQNKIKENNKNEEYNILTEFYSQQKVTSFLGNGRGKTKILLNKLKVKIVY